MSEIDYSDRALADEQARKAAIFFTRVLEAHEMGKLAWRVEDTAMIVVKGQQNITLLERLLTEGEEPYMPLGFSIGGDATEPEWSVEDVQEAFRAGSQKEGGALLEPRYHVPGSQVWEGSRGHAVGNVHLHVTKDMKLGRRSRKKSECLCSKKHGSYERPPEGETKMCAECVKVATDNGLPWSL